MTSITAAPPASAALAPHSPGSSDAHAHADRGESEAIEVTATEPSPPPTAPRLLLGRGALCEGVARRPRTAAELGTDDAPSPTTNRPQPKPPRVVEKVGRSITNETPHHGHVTNDAPAPANTTGQPRSV